MDRLSRLITDRIRIENSLTREILAEFSGTFFLLVSVNVSGNRSIGPRFLSWSAFPPTSRPRREMGASWLSPWPGAWASPLACTCPPKFRVRTLILAIIFIISSPFPLPLFPQADIWTRPFLWSKWSVAPSRPSGLLFTFRLNCLALSWAVHLPFWAISVI